MESPAGANYHAITQALILYRVDSARAGGRGQEKTGPFRCGRDEALRCPFVPNATTRRAGRSACAARPVRAEAPERRELAQGFAPASGLRAGDEQTPEQPNPKGILPMLSLSLFRSLRNCLVGARSVRRMRERHKPSRGFSPCLETLEDRCLLSVTPLGTETLVNLTTAGIQGSSSTSTGKDQTYVVAADASGNFVVAWTHADGTNPVEVRARLFFADGTARTGEIVAGTTPAGDFLVIYQKSGGPSGGPSRYFQQYDSTGRAGKNLRFATPHLINGTASVAMDGQGNFAIAWDDDEVYVQRYDTRGRVV